MKIAAILTVFWGILSVDTVLSAPLALSFKHETGEGPLLADSVRYKTSAQESFSVTRLSYLLSEFALKNAAGDWVTVPDSQVFVDVVGRKTEAQFSNVPDGEYKAIAFHVGPDKKVNHGDPNRYRPGHPLNPNTNRLHWDWQSGYIFLALEGHWRAPEATDLQGYSLHFARSENRVRVELPLDLDLRSPAQVTLTLNADRVIEGLSFAKDGATTHSQEGDPVSERMKKNLPASFGVAGIRKAERRTFAKPANAPKPIDLPENPTPYPLTLPRTVSLPPLPLDNPLIKERVDLGERLFNESLFSVNETLSCASCHMKGSGFAENRPISPGVFGRGSGRNSMTIVNMAWKSSFFWDGRVKTLREQALHPIVSKVELGNTLENVIAKLKAHDEYPALFKKAFGSGAITPENIALALENFMLVQTSFDSKFDRALKGEDKLTDEEQRGMELFFTEYEPRMGKRGADCFHCHGGPLFTDNGFHNNGHGNPSRDPGLEKITKKASDRGKFSTPTLRNIEATFPYMHDGRLRTLEAVVDHYDRGFRKSPTLDPNLAKHAGGLGLSDADKKALVAFLKTLTDKEYWTD